MTGVQCVVKHRLFKRINIQEEFLLIPWFAAISREQIHSTLRGTSASLVDSDWGMY